MNWKEIAEKCKKMLDFLFVNCYNEPVNRKQGSLKGDNCKQHTLMRVMKDNKHTIWGNRFEDYNMIEKNLEEDAMAFPDDYAHLFTDDGDLDLGKIEKEAGYINGLYYEDEMKNLSKPFKNPVLVKDSFGMFKCYENVEDALKELLEGQSNIHLFYENGLKMDWGKVRYEFFSFENNATEVLSDAKLAAFDEELLDCNWYKDKYLAYDWGVIDEETLMKLVKPFDCGITDIYGWK